MGHEVYISYSMKDKNTVLRLCDEFEKEKIDFFLDHLKLSGGLADPRILSREIRNCKVFLFICSENSYKTRYTYSELKYAIKNKGVSILEISELYEKTKGEVNDVRNDKMLQTILFSVGL